MVQTKYLSSYFLWIIFFLYSGCNYKPNQLSTLSNQGDIYKFVRKGSIRFSRNQNITNASLSFELVEDSNCAIEYWSDDTEALLPSNSAKYLPCEKEELNKNFLISGLNPAATYVFKIYAWPQKLTSSASSWIVLKEKSSFNNTTDKAIVNLFNVPRLNSEIHAHEFSSMKSLYDIQNIYRNRYSIDESSPCSKKFQPESEIFPQNSNPEKNPISDLSHLSTDGFATGLAKKHPSFRHRMTNHFSKFEAKDKWSWDFQWKDHRFQFVTSAPSMITSVKLQDGESTHDITSNNLSGSAPVISVSTSSPVLSIASIFPGHYDIVHIIVKDPYTQDAPLTCLFTHNNTSNKSYALGATLFKALPPGTYDLTVILESIKTHSEPDNKYPSWIFLSEDWVTAKIRKES